MHKIQSHLLKTLPSLNRSRKYTISSFVFEFDSIVDTISQKRVCSKEFALRKGRNLSQLPHSPTKTSFTEKTQASNPFPGHTNEARLHEQSSIQMKYAEKIIEKAGKAEKIREKAAGLNSDSADIDSILYLQSLLVNFLTQTQTQSLICKEQLIVTP